MRDEENTRWDYAEARFQKNKDADGEGRGKVSWF